jgi:hypothetical protein
MSYHGTRVSDLVPLLPPGIHTVTMADLRSIGVDRFPLSTVRGEIFAGFRRIVCDLITAKVICDLVVDGSFLTEEIEPGDIDFAVCVSSEFYDSCSPEQLQLLHWIRDDFSIQETHLCDCYLCVEWPPGHPEYFEGLQNRRFWVNLFAKSVVYKRDRGVAAVRLDGGGSI